MKSMTKLVLASTLTLFAGTAFASDYFEDCFEKKAEYQYKITRAQAQNNEYAVAKYQAKLDRLNSYCSGVNQLTAARRAVAKYEKEVREQEREVHEEEAKLRRAEASGNIKRILKYRAEVAEEKAELVEDLAKLQWAREKLAILEQQAK